MTMRALLVNAANWEGENITYDAGDGEQTLAPGEVADLRLYHGGERTVKVSDPHNEDTKPFMLNGRQVFPEVQVTIGERTTERN